MRSLRRCAGDAGRASQPRVRRCSTEPRCGASSSASEPHLIVPEIEAIATDELVELEAEGFTRDPDGARRAPHDEPRRHPPPRGRGAGPADLALSLRRHRGRAARPRSASSGCPCVVKPIMSSSGKGQSVVRATRRSRARLDVRPGRRAHGRAARCIVEGFVALRLRDHPAHRARGDGTRSARPSATSRSTATTASRGSRSR